MAAANVDQELDSIVPDTKCNGCNEIEGPCYENEVVNNTASQTDFNVLCSLCILCTNKDNTFIIECTKGTTYGYTIIAHIYQIIKYRCTQVLKEGILVISVQKFVKNYMQSVRTSLKTENEEVSEQLKAVKDENKPKENGIALLMKEAKELRKTMKRKPLHCKQKYMN